MDPVAEQQGLQVLFADGLAERVTSATSSGPSAMANIPVHIVSVSLYQVVLDFRRYMANGN